MRRKKVLALALAATMVLSLAPTTMAAGDDTKPVPDAVSADGYDVYLDISDGIAAGAYKWFKGDDAGTYYYLAAVEQGTEGELRYITEEGFRGPKDLYYGVYTSANVTNDLYQSMVIAVPAEYLSIDKEGNVEGINYTGVKNGYTATTAPIIFENNNGMWKSGDPGDATEYDTNYFENGFVYVSCGSRSRDAVSNDGKTATGKAPMPVVDLKAGVIQLRANRDVIPGDTDKIFSVGTSGAGQMSTILGASGNMDEYYSYLYEIGAVGVEKDGSSYTSKYADDVLGMQAYCPIADLENADMAYSWWRKAETTYRGKDLTPFKVQLQEDLAARYVDYLNDLDLGLELGEDGRSGSYYEAMLDEMSEALNAYLKQNPEEADKLLATVAADDENPWVVVNDDGTMTITDLDGWVTCDADVEDEDDEISPARNKDVPNFDNFDISKDNGENTAWGPSTLVKDGVSMGAHFSPSIAAVLEENADKYAAAQEADADYGYGETAKAQAEAYYFLNDAEDKDAQFILNQTNLLNATEILLGNEGYEAADPADYWRTRNGTGDPHTSFNIAFNICLAAEQNELVKDVDYALVWNMGHGDQEGTTTGTFIDWVNECSAKEDSSDPWSIEDATETELTYTVNGKEINVTQYTDAYLKNTGDLTAAAYANAQVNVYVPENATDDSPILYMVNNSGWRSNDFEFALLEEGVNYVTEGDDAENAAMALENGYIVVTAGLRSRGSVDSEGNWNHSPVTVADAKAVIRYLRYNEIGDTDKIFITGTSGGGALSVAIGSNGNSKDFYEELYTIGAAGMSSATKSNIADDVYGVIAYCPITDLGHADGSYEYTYAAVRASLVAQGYTADTKDQTFALSKETMEISPVLADEWAEYVNDFGFKTLDGKDLVAGYGVDKLTTSGTFPAEVERLLVECLQEALDEMGTEAFIAALESRESAILEDRKTGEKTGEGYTIAPANDDWKTDWIEIKDGKIVSFDMEGHAEYVALGQVLKPAVAFTNKGIAAFDGLMFNENNLFGLEDEEYGYLLEEVYDMSDLDDKYGSWDAYWADRKDELTLQAKMVDSIAYLADAEGESDTAPYWWVRHGSNDRDTSFANQTLLYHAMLNNDSIETLDFAFEFGLGHTGGYAVEEVETFMAKSIDGDGYRPEITVDDGDADNDGVKDEDEKSPGTNDASALPMMMIVVVAAAGVAFATRRRVVR